MIVEKLIHDGFEIGQITDGIPYSDGEVYEIGEDNSYTTKVVKVPGVIVYKKVGCSRVDDKGEFMELISQKGITALVRNKFDKLYTAVIYETVRDEETGTIFLLKPFVVKFDDTLDEPKRPEIEKRWIIVGEGIATVGFI